MCASIYKQEEMEGSTKQELYRNYFGVKTWGGGPWLLIVKPFLKIKNSFID